VKKNIKDQVYKSSRTVFRLRDLGMMTASTNPDNLKASASYYASTGLIRSVRKGVYVRDPYSPEELACRLYAPSYISLETVLQRAGVIFQYSETITAVSYLSRTIDVDGHQIDYRKIKDVALIDDRGITRANNVNVAIPERAFLDRLYLSRNFYFDSLRPLNQDVIYELVGLYRSTELEKRTRRLLSHDGHQ
jgi:hypothetical protein